MIHAQSDIDSADSQPALSISNISPYARGIERDQPSDHQQEPQRPILPRLRSSFLEPAARSGGEDDEAEHPELGHEYNAAGRKVSPPTTSASEGEFDLSPLATPPTGSSTPATSTEYAEHPHTRIRSSTINRKIQHGSTEREATEEEKMAAIIEDYGEISTMFDGPDGGPSEPERLLAESKGSLFKSVMLVGNLHLTTHRLFFHAMLPPDSAFAQSSTHMTGEDGVNAAMASAMRQPDILQAGPITVHQSGLRPARREWMELTAEMLTTYPSADESGRTRPLQCVLLSTIRRLEPLDKESMCDFSFTYDTEHGPHTSRFTVDTEQSAIAWRRSFEEALFRQARTRWRQLQAKRTRKAPEDVEGPNTDKWSMMRTSVPLDRVTITGVDDYHSFATLLGLDIELDNHQHITWRPDLIATGDFSGSDGLTPEGDGAQAKPKHHHALEHTAPSTPNSPPPAPEDSSSSRRFSLKATIPFFKSSDGSPKSSRQSSPSRSRANSKLSLGSTPAQSPPPVDRTSTWIDSSLPPALRSRTGMLPDQGGEHDEYKFSIAVLNDQKWFIQAIEAAVAAAHERRYKPDVKQRLKMYMTVAGYDCLATDDDDQQLPEPDEDILTDTTPASTPGVVDEDGDGAKELSHAMRKAEKGQSAAKVFGLAESDGIWLKRCYVQQGLVPARGHIILTPRFICFWRKAAIGDDIKYRFRAQDVKGARDTDGIRSAFHGMALQIHGHHDLKFEFWRKESRDEVRDRINMLTSSSPLSPSNESSSSGLTGDKPTVSSPKQYVHSPKEEDVPAPPAGFTLNNSITREHQKNSLAIGDNEKHRPSDILAPPKNATYFSQAFADEAVPFIPFIANNSLSAIRLHPRHFVLLTIGSRGDVQPYIALALRLMRDKHKVTIVTHDEFKEWIEGYGIQHRQAGGDPTALMKLSAEHKMFSPGFFKESLGHFRQWLDELLLDAWNACKDADVLIESPSAMAGIHIAEALKIPYFRAFTMPWTRTNAYPQAFMVPAFEMGPSFNYSTYVLFDNILWRATSGQVNKWRKEHLKLSATDMSTLSVSKVPFLYNFSSAVVPKPLDWHDDITITGYWNLENSDTEWSPPKDLEEFMAKARADKKPLVYIGFGSIVVPKPVAMSRSIYRAVVKADVRAVIAKGWSSRGSEPMEEGQQLEKPDEVFEVEKVPHGWLFPKVDAAMHHGGAGTVGASLRAGIPTLIKPWFGDQFFWALRVTKLEVGLKVPSLRSDEIANALKKATTDKVMIEKAARVGERIRREDGCDAAVQAIQFNITRAAADRSVMQYGQSSNSASS